MSSHGVSRRSRGFFVPNLRICEFFLHTENRGDHGFFCPDFFSPLVPNLRICELFLHTDCRGIIFFITNYRIIEYLSHGMSRSVTDFFVTRLVLGPTDRREVICELSNCFFTRNVAEITDFLCPETCPWTHWPTGGDCRISFNHTECRGWLWGLLFM